MCIKAKPLGLWFIDQILCLSKMANPPRIWDLKALRHIASFVAIMKKLHYIGPLPREEQYGIDSTKPGKKQSF